jgi:hypothetical protein
MSDRLDDIKYWSVINEQTIHQKVSLYKSDFDWLVEQAEKVEVLEKRFKEQIQNNYSIICGEDATEFRQGGYYCYECCK